MKLFYPLSLVSTAVEMTVCLICTLLLWHLRVESRERSRRILALGALVSGLLSMAGIAASIGMNAQDIRPSLLHPWLGLVYLSMHILMTLYPIMVVRPNWLTPRRYFWVFLPVALLFVGYLFTGGNWTTLPSPSSIWAHGLEWDVLIRLIGLFVMLPYCLILFALPYNYQSSSASFRWILNYTIGLLTICMVHITLTLTNKPELFIALPLLVSLFFYMSLRYELEERLSPSQENTTKDEETVPEESFGDLDLWSRISQLMDQEQVWRDPDLSLVSMARLCATNVTYLNRSIQEETGSGFKDLVNAKRIASVAAQLRENPNTDIQAAFFNAGYRSRTTAWRNFKDIMGVTPTEFKQGLV